MKNKLELGNKSAGAVGGAVGAAIGLVGGPVGVIVGGALGSVIGDVCKDMAARMLSNREVLRVGNATEYILTGIQENLNAGLIQRQDNFFEGKDNFSSDGAQLFEGILLKCKAQFQEKKVRLISNIFKNVAFNSEISPQMAYQVLTLADELTYQKLCLLSYYGRKDDFTDFVIFNDPFIWYPHVVFPNETMVLAQDLFEMHHQGIVNNIALAAATTHISPGKIVLTNRGKMAFDLMELSQISREDVLTTTQPLGYQTSWGKSTNGTINGLYIR